MRTLGISARMVAEALNAPDYVRHLPLSHHVSYFCDFNGRTIRVMTTLEDRVITVSWTTYMITLRPGVVRRRPRRLVRKRAAGHRRLNLAYEVRDTDTRQLVPRYGRRIDGRIFEQEGASECRERAASIRVKRAGARDVLDRRLDEGAHNHVIVVCVLLLLGRITVRVECLGHLARQRDAQ